MIVVVGGFARCGSSMLMRMLRAGGIPALADDQEGGLEYHEAVELPDNHAWLAKADGMAVKVLDPHRCVVPRQYDARFILMRRNVHEQALSQEKFLRTVLPGLPVERGYAARLAKSLASDWNLV